MSILPIVLAPDRRLRTRCEPVTRVDDALRRLLSDMLETMYDAPGIGLAAPQVGVLKRAVVVDVADEEETPAPLMLVNPVIVAASQETVVMSEGCLSLPEIYADVERPERVTVRWLDPEAGAEREMDADGMLARCIQHEIDHLDGLLHIDHLSHLKRTMAMRRASKAKQAREQRRAS